MRHALERSFIRVANWFGIRLFTWDQVTMMRNHIETHTEELAHTKLLTFQNELTKTLALKKRKQPRRKK